jgi:hypothetical protein
LLVDGDTGIELDKLKTEAEWDRILKKASLVVHEC